MSIEIKPLKLKQNGNWFQRTIKSKHVQKTVLYMVIGAGVSFLLSFVSEGGHFNAMSGEDIKRSLIVGALFGLFITNSPCARGRC